MRACCPPTPFIGLPPLHLLFPLCSSLLFVLGLLFVKRSTAAGYNVWTITFVANQLAALLFATLWFQGGQIPTSDHWWEVAVIAVLYISGQCFTFAAVEQGDVSVATPIFGTKVILVTLMLGIFCGVAIGIETWLAAALATVGIALVQMQGRAPSDSASAADSKFTLTVLLALGAATSFATFDVLVQTYSPFWGAGRMLPIIFALVALFSLVFLPWFELKPKGKGTSIPMVLGSLLVAGQALSLVYSLATFSDAARINVVYSTRALWGVLMAWSLARFFGTQEAELPRKVMVWRVVGASFLMAAVILVISIN